MSMIKSNTTKRILSALVGLPIYAYGIITEQFNSIPMLVVSLVITITCLYEYYRLTDKNEQGRPHMFAGILFGVLINVVLYVIAFGERYGLTKFIANHGAIILLTIIVLAVMVILIIQVFYRPIQGGIYSVATTILGLVYVVLTFSHVILIKALPNGAFYLILLNGIVMLNDSGAYFGGVLFGKNKTNFSVSPNKTWEGYFAGVVVSVIGTVLVNYGIEALFSVKLFTVAESVSMGICMSICGNVGDLAESAIKRDSHKKDSGSIIPGHGGMLDVFDALMFAIPIFYYYLILRGIV